MIAPYETFHRLTVRELFELLLQYIEHNGLSLDASVYTVVCDLDTPDDETSYPAMNVACHIEKSELYLYAAKEVQSDE